MPWLRDTWYFRGLAVFCSALIAGGDGMLYAQAPQQGQTSGAQQNQTISPQQLDSLVAPVALYPDSVLAQILAASTYPLEIVTADRWLQQNKSLKPKELVEAAGKQDWDPSVQALVAFPDVLKMLDQSLDWTTALGNAFLAQESDVMASVQRMRMKAQQSGKLQTTAEQQVQTTTVEGQPTIIIQPANPEVVYVPTYDPVAVYGAAPAYYPYPAVAYPTGAVLAAGAISFGVGVAIGSIFSGCCGPSWGWGWGCNWGHHGSLYVNNNFFNSNRNTFVNRGNWGNAYAGNGRGNWNHNPRYRGAAPYPNRDVANRFNGGQGGLRPTQLPSNLGSIRTPGSTGSANRLGNIGANGPGSIGPGGGSRPGQVGGGAGDRGGRGGAGVSQLPANGGAGRGLSGATGSANRSLPGGQWGGSKPSPANRGGAFSGGSASQARQFGNRGASSLGGGGGFRGGGGGGFRGGGGGFRGGGGGRRR